MTSLQTFMKNNVEYIIAVVMLFISLLTLFSVLGVDFNPRGKTHIDKIVTVESFINPIELDENVSIDNDKKDDSVVTETSGDVPLEDDSEETGNPIRVSTSEKQKQKEGEQKETQKRIISLLKQKDKAFQKTLGDTKGLSSHCNPQYTTSADTESHCNTQNESMCSINGCCVWLTNDNMCSAGNHTGPTFLVKNKQNVDKSKYYHMGKCYGSTC